MNEHTLNFEQFRATGLANLKKAKTEMGFSVSTPAHRVLRTNDVGFTYHDPGSSEGRAYDRTADMTPKSKGIEHVNLSELHTVQSSIAVSNVERHLNSGETDQLPQVSTHKGKTWIDDGHHRIAAFKLGGATHMPMNVERF
jgi:hypothetical protein